jgi:hypothetical protein
MYRKYLDSEITFDELVDWVATLGEAIAGQGESSHDLHSDLPSSVKRFEPVVFYHHNDEFNDSDVRGFVDLAWYVERDSTARTSA